MTSEAPRHPLPPFTKETAIEKARLAEDGWNGRNPAKVAPAYTPDSKWRIAMPASTNTPFKRQTGSSAGH